MPIPKHETNKLDQYLAAATRENTRRSYASAVRHFEVEWGGFLPATADAMARYLVDHAGKLSINTLRQRLAALAQWHIEQGFPDPTKAPIVRKALKGIQVLHPAQEKQATPLQINQLRQVVQWLDSAICLAKSSTDLSAELKHTRDKALLLIGFWRGFRGDELHRLRVEFIQLLPGQGMQCFLPQSKGDRQLRGRSYRVPALAQLCPVTAYGDWIALSGLTSGPVFRGISRWGRVSDNALHLNSLIPLLRRLFKQAGLAMPDDFSSHSLRRGFASWATASGWDIKTLMEYIGWRDIKSAMRYIDAADPFAGMKLIEPAPERELAPTAIVRK
ncbi:site-specific integrase [Chitinimonas sp. PSY-7]|uniref:tyrosine-type recombinase/integrase n=1 Tax=Chitinimonas sp. PSY-7 TaxID=3459088 RepID=UPI00404015AF